MTSQLRSAAILCLALGWALPAAASTASTPDCGPAASQNAPPVYPEAEKSRGIGGLAVLRVSLDACGRVLAAVFERSSRSRALDVAAMQAAREWRMDNGGVAGDVLVPVRFNPDPAMTRDVRTRDEHFLARRSHRHALPPLDAEGRVPAFVPDVHGLGYPTVEAAYREIARHAIAQGEITQEREIFEMIDDEGLSRWTFGMSGYPFSPFVIRERAVGEAGRGFWVTSWMCGAADAEACRKLEALVAVAGFQPAMPVPPEAPALD